MIYKNFTFLVIIHVIIIVFFSFLAGYNCLSPNSYPVCIFIGIILIIETIVLINAFNRTNRSLSYFFECIENEDTQLNFPVKIRNKSQKRLHESMNRINHLISKIKLQNERNEHYYHALIQQSATGLIAMNLANKIEIINNKACELAGIGVAKNFSRLERKNPELWAFLCQIKPGETLTYKVFREGLFLHLSICATEIRLQNSIIKLISLQDIKYELDAKEVESWQKLISILTHEIMNSIAPITSLTNTLRKFFKKERNPVMPSEVSIDTITNTIQGLEIIEERGNDLMNFVSNYRRLTKIPQPIFSDFSAYDWLNNLKILLHEKFAENQINFELSINTIAKNIYGDIKLLTQVLINIINNAIDALKATDCPRKIKITVERKDEKQTQIIISNNGPAISQDLLDKIFVPFFTTKESGSGIGLSLSRQIIQLHHGYIYVESNEITTNFVIIL
jgi:two-component system, NtrC family, nitrogen regulation sensor histidine kinase NtrY